MHPTLYLLEKMIQRKEVMIVHWLKASLCFGVAGIVLLALMCSIDMIIGFFMDRK